MTEPNGQHEKKKPSQGTGTNQEEPKPSSSVGSVGLLARVTTLAWNLVIPIVGGAMLGYYLDQRSGNGVTWTLSLLVLGVMIAFSNLYNLYIEQGRDQITDNKDKTTKLDRHEEK